MVYGIYQSAAGLLVNQYRQEVLANNLANLDTAGFKHDLSIVRERKVEAREGLSDPDWTDPLLDRMTGGSFVGPTYTSFDQGPLKTTGNPMDVAIEGDGFFVVEDGDQVRYTRDGRFTRNENGEIVTVAGHHRVLDAEGGAIRIPQNVSGPVNIHANGSVQVGGQTIGRLQTVVFEDPSQLRKTGGNLFEPLGAQPQLHQIQLRPRMVEASTVDPTRTMVDLMQVSRAYQLNATMVGLADATLNRAVNDIARLR